MKNAIFPCIFLAFVLMLPIVTSFVQIEDDLNVCALSENAEEKEQRENKETESKDELDESEKYYFTDHHFKSFLNSRKSDFFKNRLNVHKFHMDVLTPPPEIA